VLQERIQAASEVQRQRFIGDGLPFSQLPPAKAGGFRRKKMMK